MTDADRLATGPRIVGDGPMRVLAVHGWMGGRALFNHLDPFVDRDRFTFAFPDCRGYGTRRDEVGPMTIEAIAEDILAVAGALGWDTFHALGHSMGGMAVQRLMVDRPERLRSAILLAPVPASGAKIDDARRALLREAMTSPEARRTLIDANTGKVREAAWLDDVLKVSLDTTTPATLDAYMGSWTGTDFSAEADGARVAVVTIIGALDPGAPPQRIRDTIMAWYPNARLRIMEGVGHYPMLEDPSTLVDEIQAACRE